MRILFWQERFHPEQAGGLQVMATQLLPRLRRRGHEIAVIARRDSPAVPSSASWRGIAVHRLPFWQALNDSRPGEIRALLREVAELKGAFAPDVVHVNGLGPSVLFHLETASDAAPSVVALHSGNTLSPESSAMAQRALEAAAWVVGCSRAILDEALRVAPAIGPRSSVVHNGVGAPIARPALPPKAPRILCLGWLTHEKGFDLVVEALPALLARFPTLRLTIAGGGPARADLERFAGFVGVRAAVDFIGPLPHRRVFEQIEAATLVVLPSRRESFGLVAAEAALMERPVIAARTGGLAEVVVHGETGLLVEPENAAALADGIAALLEDPELARAMGSAARCRAHREFGLAKHVAGYEDVYHRVAAAGRHREARA